MSIVATSAAKAFAMGSLCCVSSCHFFVNYGSGRHVVGRCVSCVTFATMACARYGATITDSRIFNSLIKNANNTAPSLYGRKGRCKMETIPACVSFRVSAYSHAYFSL